MTKRNFVFKYDFKHTNTESSSSFTFPTCSYFSSFFLYVYIIYTYIYIHIYIYISMYYLYMSIYLHLSIYIFITLVNITYQTGNQYLPSIHSWDIGPWQVLYYKLLLLQCLYFSNVNKPDQSLVVMKVSFFSTLSLCPSFKSLLLLLSLLFLSLLLLFSLSSFLLLK